MTWLYYLAEANIYLWVFYGAYCAFLSRETHYQFNRAYLLAGCVVAFIIPLVQLDFLKPAVSVVQVTVPVAAVAPVFKWVAPLLYTYIIGVLFFAARFAVKLYQLKKLINNKPMVVNAGYKLIFLKDTDTAFSFFGYLFVGSQANQAELITRHELVHIRQKHSADIIFTEVLQIINWFNPAVYLLQTSLKTVHEYIADEQTAMAETDTAAYAKFLLNNAYGLSGPPITHSFFNYNLLKKRIIMLHQKRSGGLARLKYLIALPLSAGLLCESTLGFSKDYGLINIGTVKMQTIKADTIISNKAPKPKVNQVKFPPPVVTSDKAPKPKVDRIKFPPPVVTSDKAPKPKVDRIKFPPPVVTSDKAPKPKVDQVKFPPPVVKPTKTPPAKASDGASIRIEEPVKADDGNAISIAEPVKAKPGNEEPGLRIQQQ